MYRVVFPAAVACLCAVAPAAAQTVLTFDATIARARERAPQILSARLGMEEARGRLLGASVRLSSNPEIDAAIGNRRGPENRFTDFEIGVGQNVVPGSRRTARIAGATAAVAQSAANIDEITRVVLHQAATAFFRVAYANERIRQLDAALELASGVHAAADRRFRAGDIAVLDVNIARASLARVRAEREGAEAAKSLALGELRQLLRLEGDVKVGDSLSRSGTLDLSVALQAAGQRPELRGLEAGIQEAEAELQVGLSFSRPEYGLVARYSHEEGDQIMLGGIRVTLPMYSKGQEQRAVGSARAARLRAELDAARTRIEYEVRAAFDAYSRRLTAVRILEAEAIPGLDENQQLAARSFEVGQIALPDLLLIRREILDTRTQYLDALLEAALARTDLESSAALLR